MKQGTQQGLQVVPDSAKCFEIYARKLSLQLKEKPEATTLSFFQNTVYALLLVVYELESLSENTSLADHNKNSKQELSDKICAIIGKIFCQCNSVNLTKIPTKQYFPQKTGYIYESAQLGFNLLSIILGDLLELSAIGDYQRQLDEKFAQINAVLSVNHIVTDKSDEPKGLSTIHYVNKYDKEYSCLASELLIHLLGYCLTSLPVVKDKLPEKDLIILNIKLKNFFDFVICNGLASQETLRERAAAFAKQKRSDLEKLLQERKTD